MRGDNNTWTLLKIGHKKDFFTTSLLAQRSGARKGAPAEILVLASDTRFQGLQNSLRSDRLQSLSEIPRFARGFLTVMNLLSKVIAKLFVWVSSLSCRLEESPFEQGISRTGSSYGCGSGCI